MNPDELSAQLDELRDRISEDPQTAAQLQEVIAELSQEMLPVELMEEMTQMLYEALVNPESYPAVVQQLVDSELLDAEDFPPEYSPEFLMVFLSALDFITDEMEGGGQQGGLSAYGNGQIESESAEAQMGRGGDTMTAHINPMEARMLQRNGGRGSINPATGLPEFGFFKKLKKIFKKVAKIALPAAAMYFGVPALGAAFGGGALGSGLAGGLIGGVSSALQGGNFLKGALMGGLGGAFSGAMSAPGAEFGTLGSGTAGNALGGVSDYMNIPGGHDLGSGLSSVGKSVADGAMAGFQSASPLAVAGIESIAPTALAGLDAGMIAPVEAPVDLYPNINNFGQAAPTSLNQDLTQTIRDNPSLKQGYDMFKGANKIAGLYQQLNQPSPLQQMSPLQRSPQQGNQELIRRPPPWASNFNYALRGI